MGTVCLNEYIYQILQNVSIFRRDRKSLMYMQFSIVNFLLEVNDLLLSWTVDEVTVAVEKGGVTKDSMFSFLLF